ncbi:MAG: multicopper oxidase family protein [Steroidobacteraceae bacterium]
MRRRDFLHSSLTFTGAALSWAVLSPMSARAADRDLVEVTLDARPYRYPAASGARFTGLAYNGQVPGPLLRVRYGQVFRARFINDTGALSTIHWHGMILPNDMDGVPYVTQAPVPDGGQFIYTFKPGPPGFRWYHSHMGDQAALGLFGAFLVEDPREPRADVEVVLILHDIPDMRSFWAAIAGRSTATMNVPPGLTPNGMQALPAGGAMSPGNGMGAMSRRGGMSASIKPMPMGDAVAYLSHCVSGAAYPRTRPIIVKVGQSVRLRILNASPTLTHYVRLAGHRLRVTHSDGNPMPRDVTVDALRIGVAERYDAWFEVTRPGAWMLTSLMGHIHDHRQSVLIRTEDAADRLPEVPPPSLEGVELLTYRLAGAGMPLPPDERAPFGPANVRRTLLLGGGKRGHRHWTIDGKIWPHTPKIDVRQGDRVLIHFKNPTDMDHPMHLHGHVFELVEQSGERLRYPLLKDTTLVPAAGTSTWRFRADSPPGRWVLHCHNAVHMMDGMMTEVDYVRGA